MKSFTPEEIRRIIDGDVLDMEPIKYEVGRYPHLEHTITSWTEEQKEEQRQLARERLANLLKLMSC